MATNCCSTKNPRVLTVLYSLMEGGSHLLAPTGSDLSKYGKKGTVFAGFHYDMGLLTIHGKSNFPGLFVWLRDGTRVRYCSDASEGCWHVLSLTLGRVKVPDGCLLLQAGKQLEWLTGGIIKAGWHEVVVGDASMPEPSITLRLMSLTVLQLSRRLSLCVQLLALAMPAFGGCHLQCSRKLLQTTRSPLSWPVQLLPSTRPLSALPQGSQPHTILVLTTFTRAGAQIRKELQAINLMGSS